MANNRKVLYFTELNINNKSGGSMAAKRDFEIIKENFDIDYVDVHIKDSESKIQKLINLVFSDSKILFSRKESKKIKRIIKESDAKVIVLESSLLGNFAKYSKKCNKKVITYFQNCEYKLFKSCRSFLWYNIVKKQEQLAIDNSDISLILNQRDLNDISEIYNPKDLNYHFYPVSLKDNFVDNFNYNDEKYGLFVGSWFKPNVDAVRYIENNIANNVNCKIKVVGNGFEQYKSNCQNLEIVGTVDDLKSYILNASFMIFPVFDGSGMKVKVCEAMMYGKPIVGTPEAFTGYKKDDSYMIECNSNKEFIDAVNSLAEKNEKYNANIRNIWLNNYSYDVVKAVLIESIEKLLDKR